MYKVNIDKKELTKLNGTTYSELNLKERYDIQEWIESNPDILFDEILIIQKELSLPSRKRLDLLGIDKEANLVVIELKRDDSGIEVEWQAIKYTSYCSNFTIDEIVKYYSDYTNISQEEALESIENFIDTEIDTLNENQKIILVSRQFHSDVVSAVLWLRDFEINIELIKLEPYLDENNDLFIKPEKIIPLPEAKDYIIKKETKVRQTKSTGRSVYSLEKSEFSDDELIKKLTEVFSRNGDLIPRLKTFIEILSKENRTYTRDEIKEKLFENKIGDNIGQAGRYLSNISQFITKKSNPFMRQIIEFDSEGHGGALKNNYKIIENYRKLISDFINKL